MLGRRDAARSFVLEVRPVVTRCAAANRLRYDKLRSGCWTHPGRCAHGRPFASKNSTQVARLTYNPPNVEALELLPCRTQHLEATLFCEAALRTPHKAGAVSALSSSGAFRGRQRVRSILTSMSGCQRSTTSRSRSAGHCLRARMSPMVRTVFGISSTAAAGSTETGTFRSIPSRQACTASMSSGVKSITRHSVLCCPRCWVPQRPCPIPSRPWHGAHTEATATRQMSLEQA